MYIYIVYSESEKDGVVQNLQRIWKVQTPIEPLGNGAATDSHVDNDSMDTFPSASIHRRYPLINKHSY